jgi:16S rRNA G1207 methylase RsmC
VKPKNKRIFIFQEATIANILRAYITIKTDPTVQAKELKIKTLTAQQQKKDYAVHQLLETPRKDKEIEKQLSQLLKESKLLP